MRLGNSAFDKLVEADQVSNDQPACMRGLKVGLRFNKRSACILRHDQEPDLHSRSHLRTLNEACKTLLSQQII